MGEYVIKLPDVGEGVAEAELVEWLVKEGANVREDEVLAAVMTDKATVEIPSPVEGKILWLGAKIGEVVAVGSPIIRIEIEGEGNVKPGAPAKEAKDDATETKSAPKKEEKKAEKAKANGAAAQAAPAPEVKKLASAKAALLSTASASLRNEGEKPLASPAVRKRALDAGVDLRRVAGTGPAGRIGHDDLDAYFESGGGAVAARGRVADSSVNEIQIIGLRRKIAEKMQLAKRQIPHFTYVEEVDVTELEALRGQLDARYGEERGRITLLPLIMRAMVLALRRFPEVNARYDDAANIVTRYQPVHIGVATQTDAGLMVPVVRNAEARDPWVSAAEIARLAEAARCGKCARDELSGSTITLTSLGALGGIVSTPVINHPEVAIVGVNRIVERPVVRNGGMVARKLMNLSSSFDHRVIDGMVAAEFIQAIRGYLESPAILFVE